VSCREPGCAGHARWDRVLPPTLTRRGGPSPGAEVPETRVVRLAFRSWKPGRPGRPHRTDPGHHGGRVLRHGRRWSDHLHL